MEKKKTVNPKFTAQIRHCKVDSKIYHWVSTNLPLNNCALGDFLVCIPPEPIPSTTFSKRLVNRTVNVLRPFGYCWVKKGHY